MEDSELDATTIFKQDADQLTTVQDFEDALSRFGFTKDDKISRRELVGIFTQVQDAMKPEIFRLANSGRYGEAKEMRARLINLRAAFDDLQLGGAAKIRREQQELFEKGSSELTRKLQDHHSQNIAELEDKFSHESTKHNLFRDIQTTKLEQTISKIERPNMRYSKRLIELFRAEYNLNKLKQYDEAIKVRRMIDKLLPIEEKRFYDNFENSIRRQRQELASTQEYENNRFEEKLKAIEWREIRKREQEANVTQQRIKNNLKDMSHTHLLESRLKAEMVIKPSALWQHRDNYDYTSSSLRGQQLLDNVRGRATSKEVYAG
jgi:hypothetical protein